MELLSGLSHAATLGATALIAGLIAFALLVWLPVCRPTLSSREATRPLAFLSWALFGLLALACLIETPLRGKGFGSGLEPLAPVAGTRTEHVRLARASFALGDDLVEVARGTVQPAHASLWLRPDTASRVQQTD